jgi:hypothetical protein
MMMVCVQCLVNMRGGRDIIRSRGRKGCHMTCHGWDSQVCSRFSFHKCATTDVFYTIIMTFSHVLTCSDIFHSGYESIHHRGASCSEHVSS